MQKSPTRNGARPARFIYRLIFVLLCALPAPAWSAETSPARLIQAWVEAPAKMPASQTLHATRTLSRFYLARSFDPAWSQGARLGSGAIDFLAWLERLHGHGIDASGYHLDALRALSRQSGSLNAEQQAQADLLWTDAWLLVASHLYSGRVNPETIDPEWFSNRRDRDFAVALEEALQSHRITRVLDALHPPQPQYARLVQALEAYRSIARRGGWPAIQAAEKLEAGIQHPAVIQIRERLRVTGEFDGAAPADPTQFDESLRAAVIRFQRRQGLEPDGVIGPQTLQAMNVPVEQRIQQIILNLERWRWFPQSLGSRHVLVNIAGFDLVVMQDEDRLLEMDVIVGRSYRRTPVFSGDISYLVFNPTWTVPYNLAVQDKLPAISKDPGLLKRENFVVLSPASGAPVNPATIDWSKLSRKNFPYVLRQNPGAGNALGRVKFMFPNRHNVYLHDTPTHSLFAKSQRTFSSGCIRLSQPLKLAELLLSFHPKTATTAIQAILDTGKETSVRLAEPVPVHLTYWTAWADPDGTIQFREDVYGRDARLWTALQEM